MWIAFQRNMWSSASINVFSPHLARALLIVIITISSSSEKATTQNTLSFSSTRSLSDELDSLAVTICAKSFKPAINGLDFACILLVIGISAWEKSTNKKVHIKPYWTN